MNRMNGMWNAIGNALRPRGASLELDGGALGFSPAYLDCATMRIYPCPLPPGQVTGRRSLVAGFERGGFFYTRSSAERACEEWNLGG